MRRAAAGAVFALTMACASVSQAAVEGSAVTYGLLQGGSLVGVDLERLVTDRVGVQVGFGLVGLDAGVTWHRHPGIRTRHLFVGFWNIGVPGSDLSMQFVGMTHVWRSRGLFTAQLGVGAKLAIGDEMRKQGLDVPVFLVYSMGLCPNPERDRPD